jgi:hypothetical protein
MLSGINEYRSQTGISREEFLKKSGAFITGTFLTSIAGVGDSVGNVINKIKPGSPENINRNESEIFQNYERTFSKIYELENDLDLSGKGIVEILFVDQDGKIIDQPIKTMPILNEKSEEIAAWEWSEKNEVFKFNQEWLNEWRIKLHKKYPEINLNLRFGSEAPKQYNYVEQLRGIKYRKEIDRVLEFGNKKTIGSQLNRIDFINNEFDKITGLPPAVKNRLKLISYGVAGIESNLDNSKVSSRNAHGIWQILPRVLKSLGYKSKDFLSLKQTTEAVKEIFVKNYKYFHNPKLTKLRTALKKIQKEYSFSEEEFDKHFIFPCMINSYNCGKFRMQNVILWFSENYDRKKLENKVGKYSQFGDDLFVHMTRLARTEESVSGYGRESQEYFFRANGMAVQIRKRLKISVNSEQNNEQDFIWEQSKYAPPKKIAKMSDSPDKIGQWGTNIAGGIATIKLYKYFGKRLNKLTPKVLSVMEELRQKIINTIQNKKTTKSSRREFIKDVIKIGGGGIAGAWLMKNCQSESEYKGIDSNATSPD